MRKVENHYYLKALLQDHLLEDIHRPQHWYHLGFCQTNNLSSIPDLLHQSLFFFCLFCKSPRWLTLHIKLDHSQCRRQTQLKFSLPVWKTPIGRLSLPPCISYFYTSMTNCMAQLNGENIHLNAQFHRFLSIVLVLLIVGLSQNIMATGSCGYNCSPYDEAKRQAGSRGRYNLQKQTSRNPSISSSQGIKVPAATNHSTTSWDLVLSTQGTCHT